MGLASVTSLPSSAQIVVVGAGVMGASIASHLAARGRGDVVVLDAATIGSGSSAKPVGGFRAQFSDATNIQLGLRSMTACLLKFEERYGVDIGADRCGYLFLITRAEDVAAYEAATELQRSLGLEAEMVDPARVHALNPLVPASAVLAGQYSPMAGHALPARIIEGFLRHATATGVRVYERARVEGISTTPEGDARVETSRGTIRAGALVVAAGAWSGSVGAMAGVPLPVTPLRRQLALTVPGGARPPHVPFTLDAATTAYFHNVGRDSLLFGLADPAQVPGFEVGYDEGWLALFREAAARLAPTIAGAPVHRGWAGLYEMTPDCSALIGRTDDAGYPLLYATGFSGHGVLQSPAVGEVVADLYLGTEPFVDISRFSAARFSDGTTGLDRELAVI